MTKPPIQHATPGWWVWECPDLLREWGHVSEGIGNGMDAGLAIVAQIAVVTAEGAENGIVTKETASPGGIGFVLFVLLGVGTFLLWRSMNKQLKRVDFDEGPEPGRKVVDVTDGATSGSKASESGADSTERDPEG